VKEKSANNAHDAYNSSYAIMRAEITGASNEQHCTHRLKAKKFLSWTTIPGLSSLLERFFTSKGYRARAVPNVEQMDRLLAREVFNLVVLDLMLPGEDGLSACRRLRAGEQSQMPIIMLTAKGDELSRIKGLELGADDYLAKPFNPDELMARVKGRVCAARHAPVPGAPGSEDESVTFGDYELSLATRELKRGDEVHMLTTGEFAVLKALVMHAREPLTRDKLMNLARGREWDALERSIDVQISRLRRMIEPGPFQTALHPDSLGCRLCVRAGWQRNQVMDRLCRRESPSGVQGAWVARNFILLRVLVLAPCKLQKHPSMKTPLWFPQSFFSRTLWLVLDRRPVLQGTDVGVLADE
jgi:two-component system, OmpR family, phosphate regulon response regulator OmpR